jgi:alpha-N-arabinofuranosidase
MQMMINMKPKFLRFPGGNYLEGVNVENRFDWKKTLGPISQRPGHQGTWGYRSSDGMGLLEFLEWCEDMDAQPVLAVYAGYSLDGKAIKAGPELDPYVQEALEEIEYVTGGTDTRWGAQRAKDGHPKPFKLTYVEIGNEDFFDRSGSYSGRFVQFYDAIKAKYPQLQLISSVGLDQSRGFSRQPDVVDEHYYSSTDEFLRMAPNHYEKYARTGPKIFVGEWAAHEDAKVRPWDRAAKQMDPTPNMKAAIGDSAFMTAMERNSDIVVMQCYAPLLVNVNPGAWQWRPDLIGYNALRTYGSPSYYAISMFSQNLGDEILPVTVADTPVQSSVTRDSKTGEIIIKLVNPQTDAQQVKINLAGLTSVASEATAITLSADPNATNTIDAPEKVVPVTTKVSGVKPSFTYTVPASGIVVLRVKTR